MKREDGELSGSGAVYTCRMLLTPSARNLFSLVLLIALGPARTAAAADTGLFEVGAFWQPPIHVGGDFNTNIHWSNIAEAKIDVIEGVRGVHTKAANETGIAFSFANNVKLFCTDPVVNRPLYTVADLTSLQTTLADYRNDHRVKGLVVKDEPSVGELEGYANTFRHAKAFAPNLGYYVNLLPMYASSHAITPPPGKLYLSNSASSGDGSFVSPGAPIGQTITIPAGMTFLDGVVMFVDAKEWAVGEVLALRAWSNPNRTTLKSEAILTGIDRSGDEFKGEPPVEDSYRYFQLNLPVTAGETLFLELEHRGGGDSRVGWVVRSSGDVYAGGRGYANGVAQSYDFNFKLYTKRVRAGTPYEHYLDDWIEQSGADYLLTNAYPFFATHEVHDTYFENAEVIRSRGLLHKVIYGNFLQSVKVTAPGGLVKHAATNLEQKRWNAYTMAAYGHKKLHWFSYWTPDPDPNIFSDAPVTAEGHGRQGYLDITAINKELRNLGGTLKDLTSTDVYHSGGALPRGTRRIPSSFWVKPVDATKPFVVGTFKHTNGRKYVMITLNRFTSGENHVDFVFSGLPSSVKEISKISGAEVATTYSKNTGNMRLSFLAGEGRLFALPAGF